MACHTGDICLIIKQQSHCPRATCCANYLYHCSCNTNG